MSNLDILTNQEILEALREVRSLRRDVEALKIKRDAVFAALEEVDGLQADVASRTTKIKEHLKTAL